jgi:hypothetical protein
MAGDGSARDLVTLSVSPPTGITIKLIIARAGRAYRCARSGHYEADW